MDQGISVHQPLGIRDTYGCSTVISQQKRGCSQFHDPKTTPDLRKVGDWPSPIFSYNTTILGCASHLVSAVYNPSISHIVSKRSGDLPYRPGYLLPIYQVVRAGTLSATPSTAACPAGHGGWTNRWKTRLNCGKKWGVPHFPQ